MPLHALIRYAKDRGAYSGYVGNYGIAFRRKELFAAGARPVIYGLSTQHKEADNSSDPYFNKWLRCLSANTGIGLEEQYRYVKTNLSAPKPIDWMHEREWRWPLDKADKYSLPGMPFLLTDSCDLGFTEILIIVCTDDEQEEIRLQLKNQYDSKCRNCGIEYKISLIPAIKIISLETLTRNKIDMSSVKIEDIPFLQTNVNVIIPVSDATKAKVDDVYNKSILVSNDAQKEFYRSHPDYEVPSFRWGHAYVCTNEITEVTQALLDAGYASTFSDGIYMMRIGSYHGPDEDICALGAKAAAKFMEKELGQYFFVETLPD